MTIFYAVIARGTHVLSEYTSEGGNFPSITRVVLAKLPSEDDKRSYVYNKHVFHYIIENGITYLCLCDNEAERRIPFMFLEDIKEQFKNQYGERIHTAIAFAMNDFSRVIHERMDYYNDAPKNDRFTRINYKLNEVRDVAMESIDKVLDRGEKIELLVDKTEHLSNTANKFHKTSRNLRNHMWWKNVKITLLIIFIVLVVIYFIVSFICGFKFQKC